MNTADFKIYNDITDIVGSEFITIYAGKGKTKQSKMYINKYTFSFIEGLIWDKHREYGNSQKIKISSDDCHRILDGIIFAKKKLIQSKENERSKVLKFEIFNPENPISELIHDWDIFLQFLDNVVDRLSEFIQMEKYILILKN